MIKSHISRRHRNEFMLQDLVGLITLSIVINVEPVFLIRRL